MMELFEKYDNNELTAIEKEDFEKRLAEDNQFLSDYNIYKQMTSHIATRDQTNEALDVLQEVVNDVPKTKTRLINLRYAASIAAVLFAVLGYFGYLDMNNAPSAEELFAEYYSAPSVSLITKGSEDQDKMAKIQELYNQKAYSEYINIIADSDFQYTIDKRINLMLVNGYINIGEYASARKSLSSLENDDQFNNEYLWYTAMSYLAEGNEETAITYLEKIPRTSNYFIEATKILNQLDSK